MKLVEAILWLPPNVVDVQTTDLDGDGVLDVVVAAKRSGSVVPASIDLFVYQYQNDTWKKTKQIDLGQKAMFWEAELGLWGIDGDGVQDLWHNRRMVEQSTLLNGLNQTSPKRADIAHDMENDGSVEWLVHTGTGVAIYNVSQHMFSSSQPITGSIRQYSKTGGVQLEVAQRAKPVLFADWNGDGVKDLWWLDGQSALIEVNGAQSRISLPINVDPQYTAKPARELTWIQYRDLNGDGYTDMVWQYWVRGASWFGSSSEVGWSLSDGSKFLEPMTLPVKQAVLDVRLEDIDADGDLDLWLLGTDFGIASLSKTLLTQQATGVLTVYSFESNAFSKLDTTAWDVSIPIGQDDAFDYQTIPDVNGDGRPELVVLLAKEARLYTSTSTSWTLTAKHALNDRGNWVRPNGISDSTWLPVWSIGRPTISMLYLEP